MDFWGAEHLHSEMLKVLPDGKCTSEFFNTIVESAFKLRVKEDLETIRQISHNDLHGLNMMRDGRDVVIIDFDESSKAGATEDLWMQIEPTLDIFRRGEESKKLPPKREILEKFLCGYLAHNPYLSRSAFQAIEDSTVIILAEITAASLGTITKFAMGEVVPSNKQIKGLSGQISEIGWMFELVTNPEKQKEEKKILGETYDKVFAEISKGTLVDGLDLADGRRSWSDRIAKEKEERKAMGKEDKGTVANQFFR